MDKKEYIAKKLREIPNEKHIDYSICSRCKNPCCKITGCGLLPCDVPDISVEGIKKMLDSGKYSITFMGIADLELVLPVMISREIDGMRVKNSFIRSSCALLGENGCTLTEEERPTQALLFIPNKDRKCRALVSCEDNLMEWFPYRDILEQVILDETGKTSEQLYEEGFKNDIEKIINKINDEKELTEAEEIAASFLIAKLESELEKGTLEILDMIFSEIFGEFF